ncbi:MAG: ABC-2 family transporter protein [Planctomycetales bacterium]
MADGTGIVKEQPESLGARWRAEIRAQWTILKICLEERLVYRGDFALGTLMRFLPVVTQIFLWAAVFQALRSGAEDGVIRGAAGDPGYTKDTMIAYYLLTMVSRAFSSMPGLASGVALDIREGHIKKYLVQPIDMVNFLFWNRVAHKLVYYLVAAGPFALVFFLCRGFFPGWPDTLTLAAFVASLLMAFLLGFLLEATIGLAAFWFLEVSSLLFIYMLFSFFFSGHMFPIDLLPGFWRTLVEMLPLQYLAYFPAAVFLGHVQGTDLAWGLGIQAAWIVAFYLINCAAFHYGVKRYSGYGG